MTKWLLVIILSALPVEVLACTPNPNPDLRPWKERVAGSTPMFIGTVVEIRGEDGEVWQVKPDCPTPGATKECDAFHHGLATVVFEVEVPIAGVTDTAFMIEQGFGSDCRIRFDLGQRWLYAGQYNESPSMYLNQSYDYEQAVEAALKVNP